MSIAVCILLVVALGVAFLTNRDILSPAKFFLYSFLAFHVGALFDPQALELWMLVTIVLLVGVMAVVFEAVRPHRFELRRVGAESGDAHPKLDCAPMRTFVWIWMLSVPAILSQAYIVQLFGGFEGYVNSLALRVIEWRGLGWAKTLIATMLPANLAYFAIGLVRGRSRMWWSLYALHLLLLLGLGMLSGSRSGILNVVALLFFTYHYLRRPVKLRHALALSAVLMVSALVLGVVREGVKFDGGELTTGLDSAESPFQIASFYNGIDPLNLIVETDALKLAYGSTFLSLVTNAVPRDWWPDKPESGGIFFTKQYTGDAWDGASNLTPTFLGEWIINFGWIAGLILFSISYPTMMYFVVERYRRTLQRLRTKRTPRSALDFVVYLFIMWSVVALMTGEVTNVLLNLVLTQLIPLLGLRWLVTRSSI